jgi:hypothetical protein
MEMNKYIKLRIEEMTKALNLTDDELDQAYDNLEEIRAEDDSIENMIRHFALINERKTRAAERLYETY